MTSITVKSNDDLNTVLNTPTDDTLVVILPSNVIFNQKVKITRDNLIVQGSGNCIMSWNDHNGMSEGFGTADSATLSVLGSNIKFFDLTIENSFDYVVERRKREESVSKGMGLQAVAVYIAPCADEVSFYGCTMLGWQDTLFSDGKRALFVNCTIKGNVDFIFGSASTDFHNCIVISRGEGVVCAPSTSESSQFGFFFMDCQFISDEGVIEDSVFLARPWHPGGRSGVSSAVGFASCNFGKHISRKLWTFMKDSKGVVHTPQENRFCVLENCKFTESPIS